ncbi:MAG: succinate--CoA ligase subunit alpha [Opitutaceae bacterium]|nr:succinate--CoA ligase subunit alpha [Opitutaceae bacterium]
MSVLVNKDTRVVFTGITGNSGGFHAKLCMEYGTQVVAGVTPGKGGQLFDEKVPVFNTVTDSIENEGANTACVFVPPPFAADSILECLDAGIELIIAITEGIPVNDMALVKKKLLETNARLVGPNCPGVITPGECKIGIMPGYIHKPGTVGIVSRSGTLTYEAVWQVTSLGYGQSTCIGIGGDPINGMNHTDAIKLFNEDPDTEAIVMIGEIGGDAEEAAAAYIKEHVKKPVAGFIAGTTAPPGRRMGHAGAIVSGGSGTAEAKIAAMEAAGIIVAKTPSDMGTALLEAWGK